VLNAVITANGAISRNLDGARKNITAIDVARPSPPLNDRNIEKSWPNTAAMPHTEVTHIGCLRT